jgi:hypothetical protein
MGRRASRMRALLVEARALGQCNRSRRGHYEIATDEPASRQLAIAFTELAGAI